MRLREARAKIELDVNIDCEFFDLIEKLDTRLELAIVGTKVVLYTEYEMDLTYIQQDIQKILDAVDRIQAVYKTVGYPWEAIEILEKQGGAVFGQ